MGEKEGGRGSVSLFIGTCASVEWEKKRRKEIGYRGENEERNTRRRNGS